jgi:hypothetical protein
MGVRLMNLGPGDSVVAIARNAETLEGAAVETSGEPEDEGNEMVNGDVS